MINPKKSDELHLIVAESVFINNVRVAKFKPSLITTSEITK